MSFDWNLSEDELSANEAWGDSGDADEQERKPSWDEGLEQSTQPSDEFASEPKISAFDNNSEDEEEVDWEDVEDDEVVTETLENSVDADGHVNVPIPKLKPVTIDMRAKAAGPPKKKLKQRRRRVFSRRELPKELRLTLQNLQQACIMAWMGHVLHTASLAQVNPDQQASLLSLMPPSLPTTESQRQRTPSLKEVAEFSQWFTEWLSIRLRDAPAHVGCGRRRRLRAYESAKSRSLLEDWRAFTCFICASEEQSIPNLIPSRFRIFVNLLGLVLMQNGLHWRVRWCMSLTHVLSLDLHISHPWICQGHRNIFQAASSFTSSKKSRSKAKKSDNEKAKPKGNVAQNENDKSETTNNDNSGPVEDFGGWLEVFAESKAKKKCQWTHLDLSCSAQSDPTRCRNLSYVLNRPDSVELQLTERLKMDRMIEDASRRQKIKKGQRVSLNRARETDRIPVAYVVAVEHQWMPEPLGGQQAIWTEVTTRYAQSKVSSLQQRGLSRQDVEDVLSKKKGAIPVMHWWSATLDNLNGNVSKRSLRQDRGSNSKKTGQSVQEAIVLDSDHEEEDKKPSAKTTNPIAVTPDTVGGQGDEHNDVGTSGKREEEDTEFSASSTNEPVPKTKTALRSHPVYVLKSLLGTTQMVKPDARVCGVVRGELVYKRCDVSPVLSARQWNYQGREVLTDQLASPVRKRSPRKKAKTGFQALDSYGVGVENDGSERQRQADIQRGEESLNVTNDGEEALFGVWQTRPWKPPYVAPNDAVPKNEHGNVELALLNPGLVHIDIPRIAVRVCKELGVPYAPCLVGFEGNGGNRTPLIRGIVVHVHNEDMVRQAASQCAAHQFEEEASAKRAESLRRWKKLLHGLLVKERVDREYGGDDEPQAKKRVC